MVGFGQDGVGPPFGQSRGLLGECFEHLPFGDLAQRLHELPGGADGPHDVAVFAGAFPGKLADASLLKR